MPYEHILVTTEGAIGIVVLNRPKVLNALNRALMGELAAALEAFDRDGAVRCVVLTGNDRAFAAGADVREFAEATSVEMARSYRFLEWDRIRRIGTPIIAAVSGYALGGGCELAMACDIIIASESARFGQPEIRLGLIPGAGGTQRLTRALGKSRAMELILTGQMLSAQEACALGLVSRVVPVEVVLDEAKRLAAEVAAQPPVAVRMAKESVNQAFETTLAGGLEFERKCFHLLFGSEDKREGIRAFLDKRPPTFTGR
ncbi:MAG TPA: enoyl-CoA hydratase-related protein [bacterium]|nr:enoyl-CoA hydratase-related protein [bacterium]